MPPKDDSGRYIPLGSCEIELGAIRVLMDEPKLSIDKVIFHAPATIVYWSDGTKTVVKCQNCITKPCKSFRRYDGTCSLSYSDDWQHNGLMYAALKKTLPNYLDEFKRVLGY